MTPEIRAAPGGPAWFAVAVKALAHLSCSDHVCPSTTLAGSIDAHAVFLRRIMAQLGRAGIVEAREGRDGGYRLARAPEQITLAAVYRAVHAPGPLPVTPVDASGCGRGNLRAAFDEVMVEAEEAAVAVMERHTLADVMRRAEALGAAASRPGRS
jgi:Rrf2 family transcriptional regulator, repressor of oqxAB